jgi:hypothetical protein
MGAVIVSINAFTVIAPILRKIMAVLQLILDTHTRIA